MSAHGHPVDVDGAIAELWREERIPPEHRPWILTNMVASLDGATAVGARSAALGGSADRSMFHAIRALADIVLVGASTVRSERYRVPGSVPGHTEARRSRGAADAARLAIVTASADLPPDLPLFADQHDEAPPIVVTTSTARVPDHVARQCDVRRFGDQTVDLAAAVAQLRSDAADVVVCEGGPRLLGYLVDASLLDEWLVTLAPAVVGGASHRMVVGALEKVHPLRLGRAWEIDGDLFLRYVNA